VARLVQYSGNNNRKPNHNVANNREEKSVEIDRFIGWWSGILHDCLGQKMSKSASDYCLCLHQMIAWHQIRLIVLSFCV